MLPLGALFCVPVMSSQLVASGSAGRRLGAQRVVSTASDLGPLVGRCGRSGVALDLGCGKHRALDVERSWGAVLLVPGASEMLGEALTA